MALSTNQKIAIAVGVTAAIGLVVVFVSAKPKAATPPASDADINKVADAALSLERDPVVLRQLAQAMMVIPYSNPLHNKIGLLQARADQLEANAPGSAAAASDPTATRSFRSMRA